MKKVFLYGPPASGKTTLAKALGRALGVKTVDNDETVVARAGRSIPEIFAAEGEAGFRKLESEALRASARSGAGLVALGGGTLLDPANRAFCESEGEVICLDAPDAAELARRIGSAAGSRPLGDRAKERAVHYATFPKRVSAFFDLGDSLVVIGTGLAPAFLEGERTVADANLAAARPEILSATRNLFTTPSGEEHKTPGTVMQLWSAFAREGLGRGSRVAAVGGGVTGDLTGFAAATWMRGMDWINFPTTLLSMVDASTGGKTGCDLPEGKNLAGAFHSPKLVVIDTDFLGTLPPDILADGRAEMVKHEIIGGGVAASAGTAGATARIPPAREIAANLAVKIGIVREDPFERLGRRMLLNCGHTIGHAVEKAAEYRLSHGRCVAIGCVEEARYAARLGLAPDGWPEELAARFAAFGLPTAYPVGMDFETLKPLMRGDKKKSADGAVVFALPCGWGDVRLVKETV